MNTNTNANNNTNDNTNDKKNNDNVCLSLCRVLQGGSSFNRSSAQSTRGAAGYVRRRVSHALTSALGIAKV